MKYLSLLLLFTLLLSGCGQSAETAVSEEPTIPPVTTAVQTVPPTTEAPDPLELLLQSMSLEARVGQLFLARCNASTALEDIEKYQLGGFVLFGADFENQTPESMTAVISSYQASSRIPLLIAVDEEGGTVTRVSRYSQYRSSPFESPRSLYDRGGLELVLETEAEKCRLLSSLGINVNLGPVCDISTTSSSFMYQRSLGRDAETTAVFASEMVRLMEQHSIGSVLKHFPGYGNNADTHTAIATDSRSLEELKEQDLIPFREGSHTGADAIMVSHTIAEALDREYPATLSPSVHRYLRNELCFQGIIITDDLAMGAITQQYGAGEAAVLAVLAGNDMLCSTEYAVQYEAVLEAVLTGRIDYYTLTDAVRRILRWKQELGLI